MAENEDPFVKKLNQVEQSGKSRYGDQEWATAVDALRRGFAETGGIPRDAMEQILKTNNPDAVLHTAAREQLLKESDAGSHESEAQYRAIRQRERDAHARSKGRIR